MEPIVYGFYSIQDGSRIDNREWIHACTNLKNYYRVCWDPEKTINDKLGIVVSDINDSEKDKVKATTVI